MRRIVAIVLLSFVLDACGDGEEQGAAPDVRPLVHVVSAALVTAPGAVRASGIVGYRREPTLAFNGPGEVQSIAVDSGDQVRRGQVLAVLRRTNVGSNPDEAALARANAERDLARTQELYERGFVSEARLESARLAVERARDSSVLKAPADGVVLRRFAEPAQSVAAGAPVLALGETNSGIVVRAPVASRHAARLSIGDAARIGVAEFGVAPLDGRVTRIAAKGDDGTGAFEVEIEISNSHGLRSGLVARVEIVPTAAPDQVAALLVPTLSLLDARADQGVVFVVDEGGVARRRAVRTAGVTSEGVLVIEGLAEGERVVAAGAAYVRDGEPVRVAAGGA